MVNPRNCRHENIYWEDLFKAEKDFSNKIHCLDCGTDKGFAFAIATKRWYHKKIEEWLKNNGLAKKIVSQQGEEYYIFSDWISFIEKNNYKEVWDDFCRGRIDQENFEGLLKQGLFFEFAKSIEYLCREFKKEKEQEKPNDPNKDNPNHREREREREREQNYNQILIN